MTQQTKMTSIEWIWEQIPFEFTSKRSAFEIFEQAKQMHKAEQETLYTEEQVNQKMIDFAEWCRTQYKLNGETFLIEQLFSEYKSLKQPKKD